MCYGRKLWIAGSCLAMLLTGALGIWLASKAHSRGPSPEDQTDSAGQQSKPAQAVQLVREQELKSCLGQRADQVVEKMKLVDAKWFWCDEPPCVLRGVTYFPQQGTQVTLYINSAEPLFRQFKEDCEWNYKAFLRCRVGGIQYWSEERWFDVGPDVPWQWRRP
jgi:hypothetical protein